MIRNIIRIDEDKCNGCGLCIPNCHEGALQIIDGKARLISDLFCDGLGACIGHCPEGAITMEQREAEAYDEWKVMAKITRQGKNTILAHLDHLKSHGAEEYLREAIRYIKQNRIDVDVMSVENPHQEESYKSQPEQKQGFPGSCPGSLPVFFDIDMDEVRDAGKMVDNPETVVQKSELKQWPVQLHLLNPAAPYFRNADVLLVADCVAFAMGDFHSRYLKNHSIAIACPKLDSNKESYVQKLISMIADTHISSLSVLMMEVPCCGGLLSMAKMAMDHAGKRIPLKKIIVSIQGLVKEEVMIN